MTMKTTTGLMCAALMTAALSGPAAAADTAVGDLTIYDPWARATVGTGAGAAFFSVINRGDSGDRLDGAAADVAKSTELHTHIKDGDVMRMRQVPAIEVPANATTTLQPGGLHVMFLGMKAPLEAGSTFPLTLSFADAGTVTVQVQVRDVAATSPTGMSDHGSGGAMGGHQTQEHKPNH